MGCLVTNLNQNIRKQDSDVSLIKNDKQKKEKKLTFLNHLLALDNIFSTKSEEQEVNLVFWLPT
jgi:hypothetical protein